MEKVKVSTDGTIDFKTDETIPSTAKRFKQSPEIEAFYRFVNENDLREESLAILTVIQTERESLRVLEKEERKRERQEARKLIKDEEKAAALAIKEKAAAKKAASKNAKKAPVKKKATPKSTKKAPAKKKVATKKKATTKAKAKKKK